MADPAPPRSLTDLTATLVIVAACLLAACSELHHWIESLVSFVAY
jgi:hypothetical protein